MIIVTGTAGLLTGQWVKSCLLNMIEAATGLQEYFSKLYYKIPYQISHNTLAHTSFA